VSPAAKSGIALLVVAGLALGVFVGLQVRSGGDDADPEPGPPPAAAEQPATSADAVLPDPPGYFLTNLHQGGVEIDAMTPMLLSPLRHEHVPQSCPPNFVVLTTKDEDSHEQHVRPLFDAIGDIRLGSPETTGLGADAAVALAKHWRDLETALDRAVTKPPVRVLYKLYPQPDLPGRCVSLHMTVYTVPDQHLDQSWFREEMRRHYMQRGDRDKMDVRGVLVEIRRTHQLEGGPPRLVEACVEVHDQVSAGARRQTLGTLLGQDSHELLQDPEQVAHFMIYGGGVRRGLVWIDRSVGQGELDPWARAYRVSQESIREKPHIETEKISGTLVKDLIELAQRP
jgi:hypothetical protein